MNSFCTCCSIHFQPPGTRISSLDSPPRANGGWLLRRDLWALKLQDSNADHINFNSNKAARRGFGEGAATSSSAFAAAYNQPKRNFSPTRLLTFLTTILIIKHDHLTTILTIELSSVLNYVAQSVFMKSLIVLTPPRWSQVHQLVHDSRPCNWTSLVIYPLDINHFNQLYCPHKCPPAFKF